MRAPEHGSIAVVVFARTSLLTHCAWLMDKVDCVIVGAGVVGLAVAADWRSKGREVVVLEQHDLIGSETSSRNSRLFTRGFIIQPTV